MPSKKKLKPPSPPVVIAPCGCTHDCAFHLVWVEGARLGVLLDGRQRDVLITAPAIALVRDAAVAAHLRLDRFVTESFAHLASVRPLHELRPGEAHSLHTESGLCIAIGVTPRATPFAMLLTLEEADRFSQQHAVHAQTVH